MKSACAFCTRFDHALIFDCVVIRCKCFVNKGGPILASRTNFRSAGILLCVASRLDTNSVLSEKWKMWKYEFSWWTTRNWWEWNIIGNIRCECSNLREIALSQKHWKRKIQHFERMKKNRHAMRPTVTTSIYVIFLALFSSSTFVGSIHFGLIAPIGKCLNVMIVNWMKKKKKKNVVQCVEQRRATSRWRIRAKINIQHRWIFRELI